MLKTLHSCPILIKLEFPQQFFRKTLKQELLRKSVHWEPSCSMHTDGRTDRHDEANCRFSQFCERAKLVKKITDSNSKNQMTTKEQMEM